jgi:TolB-like protein/DNA-binding winged helix-turn-helix (wHTH) protein/Tfp pilus assembly protein PilF
MSGTQTQSVGYRVGDVFIDLGTRQVVRAGVPLAMPPLSFDLFVALAQRAPDAMSSAELMERVWSGRIVNDETVAKRVELVREALGDDSRESRYIALVRGHGYRITAPVEPLSQRENTPLGTVVAEPASSSARAPRTRAWWLAGVALLAAAAWLMWPREKESPASSAALSSITARAPSRVALAVLPLADLSDQQQGGYFADGMHDALIADLSMASGIKVISRTSTLPYRDSGKRLTEIARELDVDLIMEGSVLRAGDRVRITVQLLAADDSHVWAQHYEGDLRDVLELQSQVARAVAEAVKVKLSPLEATLLSRSRPVNAASYELYLRGSHILDERRPGSFEEGIALLQRAIELDPSDPLPYARMARAYTALGHSPGAIKTAFPRGTALALQALGLDPDLADAHLALGEAQLYFHWDWEAAEASLRRAIELSPNLASAHAHYSWLHLIHDRFDLAMEESRRAMELDPRQVNWPTWHGWLHLWVGNFEEAIRMEKAALAINPDYPAANFVLGQAHAWLGQHEQAMQAFEKAAAVNPRWKWGVAQGLALAGRTKEARARAQELEAEEFPDQWGLAEVYLALGERDRALDWLEAGYEARRDWMPWMKHNHSFRSLKDEPRFREIVRRLNYP